MHNKTEKQKEDVFATKSSKPGISGKFDTIIKRFRNFSFFVVLFPIVLMYTFCLTASFAPVIFLFKYLDAWSASFHPVLHSIVLAFALTAGFMSFIFVMIFVVPLVNLLVPKIKPIRSTWFDLNVIPWYYHNALVQLARYTILDFLAPTPFLTYFYRMMGMKVGKGVQINSTNISDPCLIQLDDYVTIGGSATLTAHYGMKGFLIIAGVHIKTGAILGLKSSVMGDVVIGKNAIISPHAIIMPKSRIEDGEKV